VKEVGSGLRLIEEPIPLADQSPGSLETSKNTLTYRDGSDAKAETALRRRIVAVVTCPQTLVVTTLCRKRV
jgi:hypothetical protein